MYYVSNSITHIFCSLHVVLHLMAFAKAVVSLTADAALADQPHSHQFCPNVCAFVCKVFCLAWRGNDLVDFDEIWQVQPS